MTDKNDAKNAPEHYKATMSYRGVEKQSEQIDWMVANRGHSFAIIFLVAEIQSKANRICRTGAKLKDIEDCFKIRQACHKLEELLSEQMKLQEETKRNR